MGVRLPTLPLVAVLMLAGLATAVLLLGRHGDDASAPKAGTPALVSAATLKETATGDRPIFWAGTGPGDRLEYTRTTAGRAYVRYLRGDAKAGDRRATFLTVGTYPQKRAYTVTDASSRRDGMERRGTPGGGLATWSAAKPTSVYLAYPGIDQLVEVFSPQATEARRLVLAGEIGPVGTIKAEEPEPRRLQPQR